MKVVLLGHDGPVLQATRLELERRGHVVTDGRAECAIFFPGDLAVLENAVSGGGFARIVLRSHAYAYGSSPKNPGLMTEERVSLLPLDAPEQSWLRAEEIVTRHRNHALLRLTNVLAPEEGDLLVRQLASRAAIPLAGHDPNVQLLSVSDAARGLALAAESNATGVFNIAARGVIPLKKAFCAAGTARLPLLKPLRSLFDASCDQLQYNWTVSAERAEKELGFSAEQNTVEALREFLAAKPGANSKALANSYDDFGLDEKYIRAWGWWFAFLRNIYWRIDCEGIENIPDTGRALFVSNHRGFMPLDGVMHVSLILTRRHRIIRFLIIHSLLRLPFLCNFLTKLGGVIASQENAARLLASENLVGIFPEGVRGAFTPYRQAYRLRDFSKSSFAKIAIENQTPIIPAAVIGHAEIFPIIGRIESSYLKREFGWPYLPIAPMFPLAPIPMPSKWHIRVLDPVPLQGLKPADANNNRVLKEFSRHIQSILQRNIDEMIRRRKHILWGRVLDGKSPSTPAFVFSKSAEGEDDIHARKTI